MADLNDIYDRLGQLTATTASLVEEQRRGTCSREKLVDKVNLIHEQLAASTKKVDDMAPHVEDYKTMKQRALALWVVATIAAGFMGSMALDVAKSFWK